MAAYFHKYTKKWIAQIQDSGEKITIGHFDSKEEADDAFSVSHCELYGVEFKELPPEPTVLTNEFLSQIFRYEEGSLYWKVKPAKKYKVGTKVGSKRAKYIVTSLYGKDYPIQNLIWLFHTNKLPTEGKVIDHIDGNSMNNRIENLRCVSIRENTLNQKQHRDGSKLYGVYEKRDGLRLKRFYSYINVQGKRRFLGSYLTPEEAHSAYVEGFTNHMGYAPFRKEV